MLEQKDFDILKEMMESIAAKNLTEMKYENAQNLSAMEVRFNDKFTRREVSNAANLAEMETRLEEKLTKSASRILDEIKRTRNILERQLQKLQESVDELNQYSRISKLEDSNISLLLKMYEDLSKRVEKLEMRTA